MDGKKFCPLKKCMKRFHVNSSTQSSLQCNNELNKFHWTDFASFLVKSFLIDNEMRFNAALGSAFDEEFPPTFFKSVNRQLLMASLCKLMRKLWVPTDGRCLKDARQLQWISIQLLKLNARGWVGLGVERTVCWITAHDFHRNVWGKLEERFQSCTARLAREKVCITNLIHYQIRLAMSFSSSFSLKCMQRANFCWRQRKAGEQKVR